MRNTLTNKVGLEKGLLREYLAVQTKFFENTVAAQQPETGILAVKEQAMRNVTSAGATLHRLRKEMEGHGINIPAAKTIH